MRARIIAAPAERPRVTHERRQLVGVAHERAQPAIVASFRRVTPLSVKSSSSTSKSSRARLAIGTRSRPVTVTATTRFHEELTQGLTARVGLSSQPLPNGGGDLFDRFHDATAVLLQGKLVDAASGARSQGGAANDPASLVGMLRAELRATEEDPRDSGSSRQRKAASPDRSGDLRGRHRGAADRGPGRALLPATRAAKADPVLALRQS